MIQDEKAPDCVWLTDACALLADGEELGTSSLPGIHTGTISTILTNEARDEVEHSPEFRGTNVPGLVGSNLGLHQISGVGGQTSNHLVKVLHHHQSLGIEVGITGQAAIGDASELLEVGLVGRVGGEVLEEKGITHSLHVGLDLAVPVALDGCCLCSAYHDDCC